MVDFGFGIGAVAEKWMVDLLWKTKRGSPSRHIFDGRKKRRNNDGRAPALELNLRLHSHSMKKAPSSSRSSTFNGFSTAREVLNSVNAADHASANAASAAYKKQKMMRSFSTAKDVMNSENIEGSAAGAYSACDEKLAASPSKNTGISTGPNENEIKVDLLVRGLCYHKENINSLESISLHREPNNLFDTNAIAVHNAEGLVVGHVAREMAVSDVVLLLPVPGRLAV